MLRVSWLLAILASGMWAEPFDIVALLKIARISEPALSPDGKTVAFTVTRVDIEKNTKPKQIYVVPLNGGTPRQLTPDGSSSERPRWSPDSKQIAFISDRGGSSQVWLMSGDGSNARQVTNVSTEAGGVQFWPDGRLLLFTSDVYPGCQDDGCNKQKLEAEKNNKVKARVYTTLLFRHWTKWQSARRSHLLSVPISGGPAKDLTPGGRDVPPFSLGGPDDYAIAPDGGEVCYVASSDAEPATGTNHDLYVVPTSGGDAKKITLNPGADTSPAYSPDGKYIAYRSQLRAGYESDRWRLVVMERATGHATILTEGLDRSVQSLSWSPDSTRIFFIIDDRGRTALHMIPVKGGASKQIITGSSHLDDVQFTFDGKTMVYSEQSGSAPTELFRVALADRSAVPLTHINEQLLAGYSLPALEEFPVEGAENTRVHSFLLKPPGFDQNKKYPVLFLIHGGPQGAWGETWSYRWNPQIFANAGYVVVMPNPRGSFGYGQKFTDEINEDWGGRVYDDIMAVVDHVARQPYTDADRMAAAGGSYGGYMVDWMLGHTNRFKAFVSHAGVYDLRSMAAETEELWFPLWEFKGMPWDNPDLYARWSPSYYAKEFKTPTLVIHGEMDYRVPYGQGLQLYTTLKMQKVPSKLLEFPDEGHWIQKPQNSILWYNTFLDWIGEWTKKAAN